MMKIKKFKCFMYREVWKILSFKDGCVYKTESIGFIHKNDIDKYPSDKYILSNISIDISRLPSDEIELLPFLGK